jgi:type IV pilus assembly protein PilY1
MFNHQEIQYMSTSVKDKAGSLSMVMVATILTLLSLQTHAAPGPLSETPLFLSRSVQPNILLMMDDSGSMDEEVLQSPGAVAAGYSSSGHHYLNYSVSSASTTWDGTVRDNLAHCAGFNVLAYDPSKTYTPWYGLDTDGVAFTDQSVTSARVNPYTGSSGSNGCNGYDKTVDNSNGNTCNLTTGFTTGKGAFYYVWHDHNNNGIYDKGECNSDPNSAYEFQASDRVYISSSTVSATQKTNFANWFSYYRKRVYVMKRAVSQIIAESRDRLGLAVINNYANELVGYWYNNNYHLTKSDQFVGTPIKDVDDLTLPVDTEAKANKVTLMDNLLGIRTDGATPLRLSLERAGAYFRGVDDGSLFRKTLTAADSPNSAHGTSPILSADLGGTCQQNFVVLLSDGFWNGDAPSAGNEDADNTDNIFDGQSYADSYDGSLADVAMSLYKGDLITSLDNDVPAVAIPRGSDPNVKCYDSSNQKTQECFDTNSAQHLVTFTVSFGVTGTIPRTDASGNECIPLNRTQSLKDQDWPHNCDSTIPYGWPKAVGDTATTADDMLHAAWNSRGRYLSAQNPDELINKLNQAISEISARKPVSAAAVSIDTFNVVNGGKVFQGRFNSADWSGQLTARTFSGGSFGNELWQAGTKLANMDINSRILVTYNGNIGVNFAFPTDYQSLGTNDISQQEVNDLLHNAPNAIGTDVAAEKAANQAYGESLVKYLRGDTSNEGTNLNNFRERMGNRLGDIVHSSPVFVGDPDPNLYPDNIATDPYRNWATHLTTASTDPGAKGREQMVYVGANDGALHAFKVGSSDPKEGGTEVFAYYPQAVFSSEDRLGMHWLAEPAYEHRYYVDMEPAVGEVYVDTGDAKKETWRTLLVGGLRGGGRAVYAIDVSDPSEFTDASSVAANVLWEFTHPDLGYTYSKPTIAKLNDGRWAAIFGNGYNQTGTSATGQAALFIKYLDTKAPSYRVLYTKVGSVSGGDCQNAASDCNGLSTPAVVDLGGDRVADRVYAGDIKGNMWVFDISSSDATKWATAYGNAVNPKPLVTAYDLGSDGKTKVPQPITSQPLIALHPTERHDVTEPNTMVYFGTGQYMVENDPVNTSTNSFYGVWDSGSALDFNRSATDPVLLKQTITMNTLDSGETVRLLSNNEVDYASVKGWFVDLPDRGERVIVNPILFGELLIYTTMVPHSNICSSSAGYSWLMVQNMADGSEPDYVALDVTGEGTFDGKDQVNGANVAGVKYGSIAWQPNIVLDGSMGRLFVPTDEGSGSGSGADSRIVPPPNRKSTRSSWGMFRFED